MFQTQEVGKLRCDNIDCITWVNLYILLRYRALAVLQKISLLKLLKDMYSESSLLTCRHAKRWTRKKKEEKRRQGGGEEKNGFGKIYNKPKTIKTTRSFAQLS